MLHEHTAEKTAAFMKLSKESWVIRWAYLFDKDSQIPPVTNACAVFWRSVLLTPLPFVGVLLVLGFAGYTAHDSYQRDPEKFLRDTVLFFITIIALTVGAGLTVFFGNALVRSAFWKYLKEHYCPLIEIEGIEPVSDEEDVAS